MALDLPLGQRGLDEGPELIAEAETEAERHLGTQLEERVPAGNSLGTLSLCKLLIGASLPVLLAGPTLLFWGQV